jgi:CheY-like chemotaxis protein
MNMPKMSGSELITALKKNPQTASIPIIIVAGRASGFDETEKRAAFAIYKDIDIEGQLEKALDAVLGNGFGQGAGK